MRCHHLASGHLVFLFPALPRPRYADAPVVVGIVWAASQEYFEDLTGAMGDCGAETTPADGGFCILEGGMRHFPSSGSVPWKGEGEGTGCSYSSVHTRLHAESSATLRAAEKEVLKVTVPDPI